LFLGGIENVNKQKEPSQTNKKRKSDINNKRKQHEQ